MSTSTNGGTHGAANTPAGTPQGAPMTLERLRALLDAYGAAHAHWPRRERAAAEALIDSSADARALLAGAAQLDALLDLVHSPAPSPALAARVRERRFGWRGLPAVAWAETASGRMRRWMTSPKHQFVAIAGALVMGLLLGAELPADNQPTASVERPAATRMATAVPYDGGQLLVQNGAGRGSGRAVAATYGSNFSSNGDPAFDAPDPFGAAAHGMDLVEGARLTSVPVPASGEPLGAIPLL
jgi:hypothetical protein